MKSDETGVLNKSDLYFSVANSQEALLLSHQRGALLLYGKLSFNPQKL